MMFTQDFVLYYLSHSLWSSFSLFVSFEHFSAFLCLSFSFFSFNLVFFVFLSPWFFSFYVCQRVFQSWSTHFSSSSSFVFLWKSQLLSYMTLLKNMWQLVWAKLATNTKIRTKLSIISNFWKVSFRSHLSICHIETSETGWLFKILSQSFEFIGFS